VGHLADVFATKAVAAGREGSWSAPALPEEEGGGGGFRGTPVSAEKAMDYSECMAVETGVSLEEYLNTSYDPDVEYVDGELVERNMGDWLHCLVQRNVVVALTVKYPAIYAVPEFRSRTRETRYRIPDVTVVLQPPKTRYLLDAAFLAIEILSEEDRASWTNEKLQEYAALGIPYIWVFDPRLRQMFEFRDGSLIEVKGDAMRTASPEIELLRSEIFPPEA
jgi:Uma2 family endonuclease